MPETNNCSFDAAAAADYSKEIGAKLISGDEAEVFRDMTNLLNRISSNFDQLSEPQQKAYTSVFDKMSKCRVAADFLGLADCLRFELPYILMHSDVEFDEHF